MKKLWITLLVLSLSAAAQAQTAPTTLIPTKDQSKYTVINGQKFFLMQNARRFNGDPSNSPGALSVMHHPRQQPGAASTSSGVRHVAAPSPNNNNDEAWGAHASSTPAVAPLPAPQNPVLSVFSPPDNSPPAAR